MTPEDKIVAAIERNTEALTQLRRDIGALLGDSGGEKHGRCRVSTECICPSICDCQCPEPKIGVSLVSNYCPVHNELAAVDQECEYNGLVHRNGGMRWVVERDGGGQ